MTLNELRGAEALDLDSGKLLDLPKDLETRPEPGQMQWLKTRAPTCCWTMWMAGGG